MSAKEHAMPPSSEQPPLRLRRPNREQVTPVPLYLDALLPDDHLARLIWAAVERLDLSAFLAEIKVVEGGPGRAAADPAVLAALWIYATSQGESRAREIDRLCTTHFAYLWLCGGVSMNYHSLADFRVAHGPKLDALITEVLGALHQAGLIDFDHVAQDGVRVRASAGAASFRRGTSLQESLAEAQAVLAAVQTAGEESGPTAAPAPTPRQQAARQRAADERVARLEAALAELPAVEAAKRADKKEQARVSTTDPEARVMKMADGGYRPAYNIEFAADSGHQVLVGVDVTNAGSDQQQAPPMVQQVEQRLDALPAWWLIDGGFAAHTAIEQVEAAGVQVLAPVPRPKDETRDRYLPRPGDSATIAAWRQRMGTAAAQATYRIRAATIECVNAQARCRFGLQQLRVRGLRKVRCVAQWIALTHNLLLWIKHVLAAPVALPAAA
jgi:transposase